MNRTDFQKLTELRLNEAKVLLDNGAWEGSYYLAGYSVECALKACIAKQTRRYDFPPSRKVIDDIYTHNLEKLMNASGLASTFSNARKSDKKLAAHWNVVKLWSEAYRYDLNISEPLARNLFTAITDVPHGVLIWLKKRW